MMAQNKATLETISLDVFDAWLSSRMRHHSIMPSLQVCIRKKGDIVFSKSYGFANAKTKRVLKNKDVFHIASHSKTFTGCVLLILQEQKKLSLSDKIIDYIPQLKSHPDKRFAKITLCDVVSHRSGIFRDGVDSCFWTLQKPFLNKEQIITEILSAKLVFAPDKQVKYSNIGFSLLGLVIEQVTGLSFADAMRDLVFKKLKTKSLSSDYKPNKMTSYADGHLLRVLDRDHQPLKHAATFDMAPATGFCGNAEDVSLFFYEYLHGTALISKKSQKELKATWWPVIGAGDKAQYGLGISLTNLKGYDLVGHGGAYPGFVTQTRHIVGTDYTISVFTNTNSDLVQWIIPSFMKILHNVQKEFKNEKLSAIRLSPVMMNNWGSTLYILGKKKACSVWLTTWILNEFSIFNAQGKNTYMPDKKKSGYDFPGELLTIHHKKNDAFSHITLGGASSYSEKEFLGRKLKNMLAD
jgi:D-alanyl-D-alanine carboxypeptidase